MNSSFRMAVFANIIIPFIFLMGCADVFAQQTKKAPNILIIFSDDHAYQTISAYGSKLMQTPNIDRIAKEGAVFKNVYVTNSLCAPSRATLLTGKYSHVNGLTINNISNPFNAQQPLFPRMLQQHNYQTAWIGKWHLQTLPDGFNFWKVLPDQGRYYNPQFISMNKDTAAYPGYVTDVISGFAEEWMNQRDTSKPFCLVVGEKATHREWLPDIQDLGAFDNSTFPMPANFYDTYENRAAAKNQDMTVDKTMRLKEDLKVHADYNKGIYGHFTPEQKTAFYEYYENKVSKEFDAHHYTGNDLVKWKYQRYMKDYLATAKSLDRNIGRLLDWLDKNKLRENTIVIYASDQGFYMGEHGWFDKRFMYEESVRTPMVMRYPGVIEPGSTINEMIVNIDFAPTLLQAAGVPVPADIQGKSFLPLLNKNASSAEGWRKAVYYHYYEYPEPHHVAPHFGIRTQRYKLIRFYGPATYWELYDLQTDPGEIKNVYGIKGNEKLEAGLKKELKELIVQYKDDEAMKLMD